MFKWIFRVLGIIIILSVLLFLGTCAFQNCRGPKTVDLSPPSIDKAIYAINITSTHQVFYSNSIVTIASSTDNIVVMQGYWEVTEGKYKYHDITLNLNEGIFGKIEVTKR